MAGTSILRASRFFMSVRLAPHTMQADDAIEEGTIVRAGPARLLARLDHHQQGREARP